MSTPDMGQDAAATPGTTHPATPDTPASPGAFDLGAHLAALIIYALEDPDRAPTLGWLAAFTRAGTADVPLAVLHTHREKLPAGPWRGDSTPHTLLESLPVFGVRRGQGPDLYTEPRELMGQDWSSANDALVLFTPMADRLPYLTDRAQRYLAVMGEWSRSPMPEPGLDRVCHQYAALYNVNLYLEAFKLLELRWMTFEGEAKELLRGLMQLAVGLRQIESGKYAFSQLEEAYSRIRQNRAAFPAPTLDRFIRRLERALRLLKAYGPDTYQRFDLGMFPQLWMVSPWRQLLGLGRG